MKREHFDARRDQAMADDFLSGHAVCRDCGNGAERETLSSLGGKCWTCYEAYRTQGRRPGPMPSPEQQRAILRRLKAAMSSTSHPRAWAHRLKEREEAGEPLSLTARQAWRAALRESGGEVAEVEEWAA